jgi:hypothetical protein
LYLSFCLSKSQEVTKDVSCYFLLILILKDIWDVNKLEVEMLVEI